VGRTTQVGSANGETDLFFVIVIGLPGHPGVPTIAGVNAGPVQCGTGFGNLLEHGLIRLTRSENALVVLPPILFFTSRYVSERLPHFPT